MPRRLQAVTFDFWNTLVVEERGHLRGRRLQAWAGVLEEAGFACEREQLDAVFERSWERYVASWTANEQYDAVRAAEEIVEALGVPVPRDVRDALIEAFTRAGEGAELHLTGGASDCLRALKQVGLRLGIICDVGMTPSTVLRDHLARHGVLDLFDHCSFSDEVGVYKPDAGIFRHALTGLGPVEPSHAAHVGDLRRTDVAGARAMGMTSVRYRGVFDDDGAPEPDADIVIDHHDELVDALHLLSD